MQMQINEIILDLSKSQTSNNVSKK